MTPRSRLVTDELNAWISHRVVGWCFLFIVLVEASYLPSVEACDACQQRLVDEEADGPPVRSPDFAESRPVAASPVPKVGRALGPLVPAARQPTGALTGRIVFTNGGHGWTWDPNYWRLQRGVTQEMNEDYGNLDQMNLFSAYCFNAGAVVVPMRPLGHQTHEVVLDNDDAEVTYTGTWANSTSSIYFGSAGDVPYRYAALAATESATANYTPNIPAAGFYPVYTWVRHGSDRTDQLYRILHTGGESQIRIPHYMVGNGWVYLGEYYFEAGANAASGSVTISNLRSSATGIYAFADAIRFGNGMGTVDRGTGVSTYPREDENCRYWIQHNLAQGQSESLYEGTGADENDSWSAPPKYSAEMNREQSGNIHKRIHVSFHSNAGGGRGAIGLITSDPTPNQSTLAHLCGAEVTADLVSLGSPPLEVPWMNRTNVTYSGGYSEIDGSLFNYEMDATILEVAFHDSVEDGKLLRDPKARAAVGRAAMHAVVKYMSQFDSGPLAFLPEPPVNLRVRGGVDGSVVLRWSAPVSSGGSGAAAGYVIYRSANGHGFGNPVEVGAVTSATLTGLVPGSEWYFRIAAVNSGGESMPSEVVGCRLPVDSKSGRVLIVNAFDRFDRTLNLRQDVTRQGYAPPDGTGAIERVMPQRSNAFDYVVAHGRAVAAQGWAFDSCQNDAVAGGAVYLTEYPVVIWACGQESTADETFSEPEQAKIMEFRAGGGHLFTSGSEIAWDLDRGTGPTTGDRSFMNTQLKADLAADANDDSGSYSLTAVAGAIFSSRASGAVDNGTSGIYWVQTPDVLTTFGAGTSAALAYSGNSSGAAAVQYDGSAGGGRVVYFGFPFETITSASRRREYMADILDYFSTPEILSPAGAVWKYLDSGGDLGTACAAPNFNDASWASGPAQLGFGEGDEATAVAGDPLRTTTYFRRAFEVAEARRYGQLRLRLLRDDGAVIWLNGTEVLRSNMPATGTISWGTQASAAVGGADENVFITYTLDARDLRTGTNVLAVELHQFGTASSDLSFDLELGGLVDSPATLIPAGATWKYRDNGTAPSLGWTTTGYSDSTWSSGAARLGYGGDGEVTVISNGGNAANVHPTSWFRHTFVVTDPLAFDALRIDLQRDDGVVVYLNGTELLRDNLPSQNVTSSSFAAAAISGADETAWKTFLVPAAALRTGSNVLAVEMHQSAPNSSDVGFDLRLSGLTQISTSFAAAQAATFGSDVGDGALTGDFADPDNDGLPNLIEYATGSGMNIPSPAAAELWPGGPGLGLHFTRNALAAEVILAVEAAEDLSGPWTVIASSTSGNPLAAEVAGVLVNESAAGAVRQVEVRDFIPIGSAGQPRRFLRLRVSR